jgi:carbamoyl-phosphate synthase large subunit
MHWPDPMSNPSYTIAVTGLNAIDSPGPGVPVVRALREARSFNARIIGLAYETLEPGIYMHDIIDRTYRIPYPSSGTEFLVERIMDIHRKEKLDVIIPNFDAEIFSFIRIAPELKACGIQMFLPTLKQFEERHKVNLPEFGKKYDIRVPESTTVNSVNDIEDALEDFDWPILVKGKFYDATIAYNKQQVTDAFRKIAGKWGLPIILQEHIRGTEYNVTGLGDGAGNTIAAVPMRKQYITDKGKAWGGITITDQHLLDLTHHFIRKTNWRGSFELELMKTGKEEFFMLEINPRIPAWIYLAVGAGQNIPEALVNLALGKPFEPYSTYHAGKMFIRYSWDMIVDLEEFQKISTEGEL